MFIWLLIKTLLRVNLIIVALIAAAAIYFVWKGDVAGFLVHSWNHILYPALDWLSDVLVSAYELLVRSL